MTEIPTVHIHTATMKLTVLGDRAILEASFRPSPVIRRALGFVLGVSSIWAVEQCWRWASVMIGWLG